MHSMLTKQSVGTRPARLSSPAAAAPQRSVRAAAAAPKSGLASYADSIGLPTDEGVFGFKPFAEAWTGRMAMMGFIASIVGEATSGKGTLAQIGLSTAGEPNTTLLIAMSVLFGGATVAGTAMTVQNIFNRKMSSREIARYKGFLGLNNADDFLKAAQDMKRKGDFTAPGVSMAAVEAAKAAGTPADKFLAMDDAAKAAAAAAEMKAGGAAVATAAKEEAAAAPAPRPAPVSAANEIEERLFFNSELKYARRVEIENGRYAMMGFLAALMVEAATGKGIILQIIMYLKLSGLLGDMSGF